MQEVQEVEDMEDMEDNAKTIHHKMATLTTITPVVYVVGKQVSAYYKKDNLLYGSASYTVRTEKKTRADWLSSHPISPSVRPASLGGKFPSSFDDQQTRLR